jgi:hypothetical protein
LLSPLICAAVHDPHDGLAEKKCVERRWHTPREQTAVQSVFFVQQQV